MTTQDLQDLRQQIEKLDKQLLETIAQRFQVAQQIAAAKHAENNETIYDPAREHELLEKWISYTNLDDNFVRALFHMVLNESRNLMIRK